MAYYDDWPVLGAEEVNPRQQWLEQYEEYLLRVKQCYERRGRFWNRDYSGLDTYVHSVPNRQHFLDSRGWPWDRRLRPTRRAAGRTFASTYRVFDGVGAMRSC